MKSKWPIILLVLVVVGIIIIKQMPKKSPAGNSAETGAPSAVLPGSQLPEVLQNGLPTMADFGKNWCKPCKAMEPVLRQAAADYQGKANIVFVDLEQYAILGNEYKIATMPTQIFFDKTGKETARHIGFLPKEEIDKKLAALGAK
jgi:thioredoxin 1